MALVVILTSPVFAANTSEDMLASANNTAMRAVNILSRSGVPAGYVIMQANGRLWLFRLANILATTAINNLKNQKEEAIQSINSYTLGDKAKITAEDEGVSTIVGMGEEGHKMIETRLTKMQTSSGNQYVADFYGDQLIQFGVGEKVPEFTRDTHGNVVKNIPNDDGKVYVAARSVAGVVEESINVQAFPQAKTAVVHKNGEIALLADGQAAVAKAAALNKKTGYAAKPVAMSVPVRVNARAYLADGSILVAGDYRRALSYIDRINVNAYEMKVGRISDLEKNPILARAVDIVTALPGSSLDSFMLDWTFLSIVSLALFITGYNIRAGRLQMESLGRMILGVHYNTETLSRSNVYAERQLVHLEYRIKKVIS
ncbi:hypothetical protein AYO45_03790 [Gammaproteobacteria bacterium SCGC AG-212-F23]|nr:hypothetical protein AYO45_03790 [Gammaproteobacteria bacterium SCGC AG-212-F23]